MFTREEVLQRAVKIINDHMPGAFGDNVTEDTLLNPEGNMDSMGFILVLTKLEGEFGVKIPDNTWNKLRTLRDLVDAIMANKK